MVGEGEGVKNVFSNLKFTILPKFENLELC